jgi:hypothetical protein
LDELDHQEIHIRRLARRVDMGSPFERVELSIARKLQGALDLVQEDAGPSRPHPGKVTVARAQAQAIAIRDLAAELQSFGVKVDPREVQRQLERDREAMRHRLEIEVNEAPDAVDALTIAVDYYELIFNPQQEILLRLDFAMDEIERLASD